MSRVRMRVRASQAFFPARTLFVFLSTNKSSTHFSDLLVQ